MKNLSHEFRSYKEVFRKDKGALRDMEEMGNCAVVSDATPYTGELKEAVCTLNKPGFDWMKEAA